MKKIKERLTIFLAAGASVRAGIPSTFDLTNCVRNYPLTGTPSVAVTMIDRWSAPMPLPISPERPVFDIIFRALQARLDQPNFEHILAVLEELSGLASSTLTHDIADDFVNVLAPFVTIDERYRALRDTSFLHQARQRYIKALVTKVNDSYSAMAHIKLEQFLAALREKYLLSVFTLNYDDLVERCAPNDWYDGFTIPKGSPAHYLFDRKGFADNHFSDQNILCHMHGSVLYGYSMGDGMDLVKFDTATEASKSLDYGMSDTLAKGQTFTKSPIITGFSKAAKLTYTPIPYGHYFRAFANTLMNCQRMVVVGYGGYDDHVNAWFDEFIEVHGDKRRVVYVTPRPPEHIAEKTAVALVMEGFAGQDVIHSTRAFYSQPHQPEEFHRLGNLSLCAAGFPLASFDSTMPKILDFLDT